jgi:hypothetical protein
MCRNQPRPAGCTQRSATEASGATKTPIRVGNIAQLVLSRSGEARMACHPKPFRRSSIDDVSASLVGLLAGVPVDTCLVSVLFGAVHSLGGLCRHSATQSETAFNTLYSNTFSNGGPLHISQLFSCSSLPEVLLELFTAFSGM